jgi:hypothetical protein
VGLIVTSVFQLTFTTYSASSFPTTSVCIGMLAFGASEVLALPAPLVVSRQGRETQAAMCRRVAACVQPGCQLPRALSAHALCYPPSLQVIFCGGLGVVGWAADMK